MVGDARRHGDAGGRSRTRGDRFWPGEQEAILENFPDGWSLDEINLPEKFIAIRHEGDVRRMNIGYESAGSPILSIAEGPDGRIHGSTGHPLRFYTYDTQADTFVHRGLWTLSDT